MLRKMNSRSGTLADSLIALFLLILTAATVVDLAVEDQGDLLSLHALTEGLVSVVSLTGFIFLFRRVKADQRTIATVSGQLHLKSKEATLWKKQASVFLKGLSIEIQAQFDRWSLTKAEREVALWLLKGFSHKEIASFSDRSERTVRQHSSMVYQKSGLTGRAELAAFFLEDLLAPEAPEQ
jgi:DNA-binding CsgD family transcriptional regulator